MADRQRSETSNHQQQDFSITATIRGTGKEGNMEQISNIDCRMSWGDSVLTNQSIYFQLL